MSNMNRENDVNTSDSDSDEDYCPDRDAANVILLSEEEEEVGVDDVLDDDNCTGNERKTTRTRRKKEPVVEKVEIREIEDDTDKDKSRTDALWADFLNDVKPTTKTKEKQVNNSLVTNGKNHNEKTKVIDKEKNEPKPNSTKKIVEEILDFAGEEVHIQKTIFGDGVKENKIIPNKINDVEQSSSNGVDSTIPRLKRPFMSGSVGGLMNRSVGGGLGGLLNQIGKKKKLSVLEKSKMDWNNFKQHEGIDEDIQTHNKGRDGYLERQDFLQRTDLRQFEIEKDLRRTARRNP